MSLRSASSSILHIINLTDTKVTEQYFDFSFFFQSSDKYSVEKSPKFFTWLPQQKRHCFLFVLCFLLLFFYFLFIGFKTKCKMPRCSCARHTEINVPISSFIIKHKFKKHQGCRSQGPLTWPGTSVGSCWRLLMFISVVSCGLCLAPPRTNLLF